MEDKNSTVVWAIFVFSFILVSLRWIGIDANFARSFLVELWAIGFILIPFGAYLYFHWISKFNETENLMLLLLLATWTFDTIVIPGVSQTGYIFLLATKTSMFIIGLLAILNLYHLYTKKPQEKKESTKSQSGSL